MQIKPSASIRQNYNEIAALDIAAFARREKMLKLREELLAVEEDRLIGRAGTTPDELDNYLNSIIDEVEHGKETSI
jgi:hypothetical protein